MQPFIIDETANKRRSALVTVVVHAAIFAACLFLVKWTPPDPPLSDYGVELNFGIDEEGSGNLQTLAPANDAKEDAKPDGLPTQPPKQQEPEPETRQETPVVAPKQEEVTSDLTSEEESPITAVVKPEPKRPEPVKPKPIEKPEAKPAEKPKPAIDASAIYNTKQGTGGVAGTSDKQAGNNNGDRPGKVGDQGDRRGTLNGKALYGEPGTGNSSTLDLVGWTWDSKPDQIDASDETGRIVFEIKIDEEGNIINVRSLDRTISSPRVIQFYQKQIEQLTFSKTGRASAAGVSTGRITINIGSR